MAEINALDRLRKFVDAHPTQKDAAVALGIKPSYLSELLHMRRDITTGILTKLGLKRVVVKQ